MPHDEIAYVREALLDGRNISGENPVMYSEFIMWYTVFENTSFLSQF